MHAWTTKAGRTLAPAKDKNGGIPWTSGGQAVDNNDMARNPVLSHKLSTDHTDFVQCLWRCDKSMVISNLDHFSTENDTLHHHHAFDLSP